uniref:SHSP domain-containing protein n=1 Tax=Davidia involucrata TaxID=16924 RepID=A0A5B7B780_DAVIN
MRRVLTRGECRSPSSLNSPIDGEYSYSYSYLLKMDEIRRNFAGSRPPLSLSLSLYPTHLYIQHLLYSPTTRHFKTLSKTPAHSLSLSLCYPNFRALQASPPMASSLALKRLVSSNLLPKSLLTVRSVTPTVQSASRLFNTNAVRDYDDDDRSLDVDRRPDRSVSVRRIPNPFSDVFDAFSGTRNLSQILNTVDQLVDSPFLSASRGIGAGIRRGWDARETDDGLYLRVDMPGLGKENVKVSVEQNTLIIKGEGEKESEDEESARRYTSRIFLPEKLYKVDDIKAEMKNGVLKVVVPKVKEEERSDVFNVKVE